MKFTVLVADDEELERRALRRILGTLEEQEIDIVEAENGRQAIEVARETQPDLALLDIRMPGVDGIDAARELKTVSPRTRCVFVTAFESFDYAREAVRLGADEYLLKPAEPEAVRSTVLRSIERARSALTENEQRKKTGEDGERALGLLERELRDALGRNAVDGTRLEEYLQLRGRGGGTRLAVVIRPECPPRGDRLSRLGSVRRLAELAEVRLRAAGWFTLAGSDEAEVRLAVVANSEGPALRALEALAASCATELACGAFIGAAPAPGGGMRDLFAPARDALALCRREAPVVLLQPRSEELPAENRAGSARGRMTVDRAIEVMRARLAEDIPLTEVAAAVRCSPYHLSRLFTLYAGDTFVSVFARMRVDAAKSLLRTGEYSVKEVCAMVGFRDQTYFSRVFKKFEGVTPAEFAAARGGHAKSSDT